jgi:hypothetical protein
LGKNGETTHQFEASALAGRVACASGWNSRIVREKEVVGEQREKTLTRLRRARLPGGWLAGGFCASERYPSIAREKEVVGDKRGKQLTRLRRARWPGGWLALAGGTPELLGRKGKQGTKLTRLRRAHWPGGWLAGGFCASGRYPRIEREKEVVGDKRGKTIHQVLAGWVACGWLLC